MRKSNARQSLATRLAHLREARTWLSRRLETWDGWGGHHVSSSFNTTRREQAAHALAQCDAALSQWASAASQ